MWFRVVTFFMGLAALEVRAQSIDSISGNQTALVGEDMTMQCTVSGISSTDNVFWKKSSSILTINNIPAVTSKYTITVSNGIYNMTVINMTTSDAGTYTCEAGTGSPVTRNTYVIVVDAPTALNMTWSTTPAAGVSSTLSCFADESKPAATLRLFLEGLEVTSSANVTSVAGTGSGYFDSTLAYDMNLTTSDNGKTFTCQADYTARTAALQASKKIDFGGAGTTSLHVSLLMVVVLVCVFSK
ncbi:vascular endothelial growth factor receptor 1-like [Lineus longissimus]|uniref:vascular endothelial growth factor receptor 1-like n=1 Tax=Lineus longissimus TaxID=88925 RepID=UPI002B4D43F9